MQKLKFFISIVGTAIMIYIMGATGKGLKTPTTPYGILNLEFANTSSKANIVIKAWEDNLLMTAKVNTWFDFVFLFFYSFLFYNFCKWINHLLKNKYGTLGLLFSKLSIVTALLDVVENIFMLKVLSLKYTQFDLTIMTTASYIKWFFVIVIILYLLIGFGIIIYKKVKNNYK